MVKNPKLNKQNDTNFSCFCYVYCMTFINFQFAIHSTRPISLDHFAVEIFLFYPGRSMIIDPDECYGRSLEIEL